MRPRRNEAIAGPREVSRHGSSDPAAESVKPLRPPSDRVRHHTMPPPPVPSPSSRHAQGLPSLDPERMDVLRELCVDAGPEVLREMFGSWETEAAKHLAGARQSLAAADTQAVKVAAHALKGSCANIGVVRLAELGRLLESQASVATEASILLAEMQEEFERAREQLARVTV